MLPAGCFPDNTSNQRQQRENKKEVTERVLCSDHSSVTVSIPKHADTARPVLAIPSLDINPICFIRVDKGQDVCVSVPVCVVLKALLYKITVLMTRTYVFERTNESLTNALCNPCNDI